MILLHEIIIYYCTPLLGITIIIYGVISIHKKRILVGGDVKTGKKAVFPGILAIIFGLLLIAFVILIRIYSNK